MRQTTAKSRFARSLAAVKDRCRTNRHRPACEQPAWVIICSQPCVRGSHQAPFHVAGQSAPVRTMFLSRDRVAGSGFSGIFEIVAADTGGRGGRVEKETHLPRGGLRLTAPWARSERHCSCGASPGKRRELQRQPWVFPVLWAYRTTPPEGRVLITSKAPRVQRFSGYTPGFHDPKH